MRQAVEWSSGSSDEFHDNFSVASWRSQNNFPQSSASNVGSYRTLNSNLTSKKPDVATMSDSDDDVGSYISSSSRFTQPQVANSVRSLTSRFNYPSVANSVTSQNSGYRNSNFDTQSLHSMGQRPYHRSANGFRKSRTRPGHITKTIQDIIQNKLDTKTILEIYDAVRGLINKGLRREKHISRTKRQGFDASEESLSSSMDDERLEPRNHMKKLPNILSTNETQTENNIIKNSTSNDRNTSPFVFKKPAQNLFARKNNQKVLNNKATISSAIVKESQPIDKIQEKQNIHQIQEVQPSNKILESQPINNNKVSQAIINLKDTRPLNNIKELQPKNNSKKIQQTTNIKDAQAINKPIDAQSTNKPKDLEVMCEPMKSLPQPTHNQKESQISNKPIASELNDEFDELFPKPKAIKKPEKTAPGIKTKPQASSTLLHFSENPEMSQLNSTNANKSSFIKRKLFTQTLDILDNANNTFVDSPEVQIASKEQRRIKKIVSGSCLNVDVFKEDAAAKLSDCLEKLGASDRLSSTRISTSSKGTVFDKRLSGKRDLKSQTITNMIAKLSENQIFSNENNQTVLAEENDTHNSSSEVRRSSRKRKRPDRYSEDGTPVRPRNTPLEPPSGPTLHKEVPDGNVPEAKRKKLNAADDSTVAEATPVQSLKDGQVKEPDSLAAKTRRQTFFNDSTMSESSPAPERHVRQVRLKPLNYSLTRPRKSTPAKNTIGVTRGSSENTPRAKSKSTVSAATSTAATAGTAAAAKKTSGTAKRTTSTKEASFLKGTSSKVTSRKDAPSLKVTSPRREATSSKVISLGRGESSIKVTSPRRGESSIKVTSPRRGASSSKVVSPRRGASSAKVTSEKGPSTSTWASSNGTFTTEKNTKVSAPGSKFASVTMKAPGVAEARGPAEARGARKGARLVLTRRSPIARGANASTRRQGARSPPRLCKLSAADLPPRKKRNLTTIAENSYGQSFSRPLVVLQNILTNSHQPDTTMKPQSQGYSKENKYYTSKRDVTARSAARNNGTDCDDTMTMFDRIKLGTSKRSKLVEEFIDDNASVRLGSTCTSVSNISRKARFMRF